MTTSMVCLRYIGTKTDGERAYEDKTGLVWMPGSKHTVSVEHADLLCQHPDVWELTDPQAEATQARAAADKAIAAAAEAQALADEANEAEAPADGKVRGKAKRG